MTTLFVNRLTAIDFSYLSPSRGLVGESWQVDVELEGDLDCQGMVLDVGEVKQSIKRHIDEQFDHKLLVPAEYAKLNVSETPQGLYLRFTLEPGREIEHRSPRDALHLLPLERIAPDRPAQIQLQTSRFLPKLWRLSDGGGGSLVGGRGVPRATGPSVGVERAVSAAFDWSLRSSPFGPACGCSNLRQADLSLKP